MEVLNKRRDRHDIVAEILKTARGGKIKTHIMYKAKLSYSQTNEYLNLLIEKGLLENMTFKQKRRTINAYKTTEKGVEFLNRLDMLDKIWALE